MRRLHAISAACCALVVAGCVSVPAKKSAETVVLPAPAQADAMTRQQARERQLRALPTIAFDGRVALSNGRDGGSGRIEWKQAADRYAVTLSAPVTRQSWTLTGDAHGARIDGVRGGPREDTDVARLLKQATGFDVPVGALSAWSSGARADTVAFGEANLQFDAAGTLVRLLQDGWTVDYLGWQDVATAAGEPPLRLPDRIDAHHDAAKVRLAIDHRSFDP